MTQVLEVLEEAHEWLCHKNEGAVRAAIEERGWQSAFDLQPDVPFPERWSRCVKRSNRDNSNRQKSAVAVPFVNLFVEKNRYS